MKHTWKVVALSSVLALALTGCGKADSIKVGQDGQKTHKLVFATTADGGAFGNLENGKFTGFDIDVVESIAKKEGYTIEWKDMKFDGIIPSLKTKQIDGAAAAITIRDDRKAVTNFTDSYFESGLVLVVKDGSSIKDVSDLKGKTIVAKNGTSGLEKANELAKKYGAKVKILEDEPTLYLDVQNGQSDALINDYPFVADKMKSGTAKGLKIVGERLTGEDYGIAIAKNEPKVLKDFNEGLKELKEDGTYDKLHKQYFGE
ncbi:MULTISPECIES: transporter substrate-binding domain-containing protein [Bacillaceae]|uniref:ABC transporter substrate-binding protein n=1 Tax=Gottfriedia luciferensis TaxID=178774 RepID=A0ABX2ZX53_9BACI|nr:MULTISPECIES: transporter substrate-binding domain-containing protein [Bacillaceae]ODG93147.1 ABC transporter substrate-binding protein [Gottfriedia luciferensis]PGZ91734.1 ABC transporter substrate-binding protein [Bacillus sp. AFS029533]SFD09478.1 polar amino acid transport system substrate-binding protein [Bacillus sp. UNCCL81]